MTDLPSGTVTFLFSDIQGSTELLKQLREQYADLLADQRRIMRAVFSDCGGQEVDTQGDSFFVSFSRASEAVTAAVTIQRELAMFAWPEGVEVRVRMGLHTGEPWVAEEGYVGIDVHRAARIAHIGHGGQVLLSETTTPLVRGELPEGVILVELGSFKLKDIERPEPIHQLVIEGLAADFPTLKARLVLSPVLTTPSRRPIPAFLNENAIDQKEIQPVFVARELELARLAGSLEIALSCRMHVAFLAGGPGRGKTALMQAFAQEAMASHPELLVVTGGCAAYTGVGDPYLPFRDVFSMLTGEVVSLWASGIITTNHAKRLWKALPVTARALVEEGQYLPGVFLNVKRLLGNLVSFDERSPWQQPLHEIAEQESKVAADLDQQSLFEQVANTLQTIAAAHPLLILLDDLQWADKASLNLLFHLGRRLRDARVMLLGAYRPEEIALGRDGQRHPLEKVLAEFKRQYGDIELDLSGTELEEGRTFVEALIDSEPNRLSATFRTALLDHTGGHPLFTIELLRDLQERGAVVQDANGSWVEGLQLDWRVLPAKVEGVIEERIGRLADELRETLTVASVEGEDFTAQVVARVQQADERGLVRQLSRELDKRHRLVGEQEFVEVGSQRLFRYRFRHSLFQQHLYNGLSAMERQLLHIGVGTVLETLYGDHSEEIATQLAWHFVEAGEVEKAIPYLISLGDRARGLLAQQEAVAYYQQALEYLKTRKDYEAAARILMKLGLTYHTTFDFQKSRMAFDEAFALRRIERLAPPSILPPAQQSFRLVFAEPPTLDPTLRSDRASGVYLGKLFSALVELGRGHEITPDSAHRWEISDNGCQYLFHLRDDISWSDGTPVTAMDFEFAGKRILNPDTKAPYEIAGAMYDIEGAQAYHQGEISDPNQVNIKAIDPLMLKIGLRRPAGYFLHLLTGFYPAPRHVVMAHGEAWTDLDHIVTNGPFRLAAYQPGKSIALTRNPSYHRALPGNIQKVEVNLSVRNKSSAALNLYETGEVDLIILGEEAFRARHSHAGEYFMVPELSTYYVAFDASRSPFDDQRVRQAFVMAVNREQMADEVLDGMEAPATGGLVPPGMPGHSPGIGLPYDPDEARRLLTSAGYPGGDNFPLLEIKYLKMWNKKMEFLQSQWFDNLNIEITIEELKWADLIKISGERLRIMGWYADYPDPDSFLRMCVRSHLPHWANEPYHQLLKQAQQTLNQGDRIPLYRSAERILVEEAGIMPLTYFTEHMLIKPWVKSTRGMTGSWNLDDVTIQAH